MHSQALFSSKMIKLFFVLATVLLLAGSQHEAEASDVLAVCVRNCAQCKKMYGEYFEGKLCAEACLKFKGELVPECTDMASIAPFLNNLV
ncbi:eclosion hormone-like [Ischnura elegans]|uniref:eclosion hormone-like n=1 Tax=Ischnura elegans TaxID=197161 RepID=UPI001ED868AF|nr:eclosion hormone-like [Ischnura elegans]